MPKILTASILQGGNTMFRRFRIPPTSRVVNGAIQFFREYMPQTLQNAAHHSFFTNPSVHKFARSTAKMGLYPFMTANVYGYMQHIFFIVNHSMSNHPSEHDPEKFRKLAEHAFKKMGISLEHHPLSVSTQETDSCATINTVPGSKRLELTVDPDALSDLEKPHGGLSPSKHERYLTAVLSHEASHALHNDNFNRIFLAAFVAAATIRCCQAWQFYMLGPIVAPLNALLTSAAVGRRQEMMADQFAAKDPQIREDLISILQATADQETGSVAPPLVRRLFNDHPSAAERLQALKELPPVMPNV